MKTFTNIFILILGIVIGFHGNKIVNNLSAWDARKLGWRYKK